MKHINVSKAKKKRRKRASKHVLTTQDSIYSKHWDYHLMVVYLCQQVKLQLQLQFTSMCVQTHTYSRQCFKYGCFCKETTNSTTWLLPHIFNQTLYNKHSSKVDTQDQCHQLIICPNVSPSARVMMLNNDQRRAEHHDVTEKLTFCILKCHHFIVLSY